MTSIPRVITTELDFEAIQAQLWARIDSRLDRGDTLVRPRDFQRALEADYTALTGQGVSHRARRRLANAVITINRSQPERYVGTGIDNSVRGALQEACSKLRWDSPRIRASGPMVMARFKSQDRVRDLLEDVGLGPGAIDAEACVTHASEVAAGIRRPLERHHPGDPFEAAAPQLTVVSGAAAAASGSPLPGASHQDDGAAAPPSREDEAGRQVGAEQERPLSNEERRQGALVGRVEMRVAGATRRVARKLMSSPDGSGRHVLARRNLETGELEPALRRSAPRPVKRGIDGVWRETT